MSRYSQNQRNKYLDDDEDPLLAGQINTVMDYRKELGEKKKASSTFIPHSAEYYLTHDFSDELKDNAAVSRASSRTPQRSQYTGTASNYDLPASSRRTVSAKSSPFRGSTPWHTPDPGEEDLALAADINTIVDLREELKAKQSMSAKHNRYANYGNNSYNDDFNEPIRANTSNPRLTTSYYDGYQDESSLRASTRNPRINPSYYDDYGTNSVQRTSTGDPRLNPSYNDYQDADPIRRTTAIDPRLYPSYNDYEQPEQVRRTGSGDPRLYPSYNDYEDPQQVRRTTAGDPRLYPSYNDYEEPEQVRRTTTGDPRLYPSYNDYEEPQQVRRTTTGDPRLYPSYNDYEEPQQVKRTTTGDPRLYPSYNDYEEPEQVRRTTTGNPRLHPTSIEYDEEPQPVRRTTRGNPRLNNSNYMNDQAFNSDDENENSIPWHTPDPNVEDPCLAGQINLIIDYRSELAAKQNAQRRNQSAIRSNEMFEDEDEGVKSKPWQSMVSPDKRRSPQKQNFYRPQKSPLGSPQQRQQQRQVPQQQRQMPQQQRQVPQQQRQVPQQQRQVPQQQRQVPQQQRQVPQQQRQMPQQQRQVPQQQRQVPQQQRQMPQQQPQKATSPYSYLSAPVSPHRTSQVNSTINYSKQAPVQPQQVPQSNVSQQNVSKYSQQQPSQLYVSYHQNESQAAYKYVTKKGSDESDSLYDYNDISDSLSEDERKQYTTTAKKGAKSSAKRLHKALAHLDNASRILDHA